MKRKNQGTKPGLGRKRPYQAPKLGVYGDLRRLTKQKDGNMNDGAGKPMTRAGGSNT